MDQDQQTYSRAVSGSLIGLVVQAAVAFGLLYIGRGAQDAAVTVGAWYAFGGLLIWICLAVLYQQHKLERLESMETEQLAERHGTESSIFETSAVDLVVARKRLERLYRLLVPITSLLVAAYLIGIGLWRTTANLGDAGPAGQFDPNVAALLLAIGALVAFLISRYIAGMAELETWQALRGGAGYLMGTSVACAALALAFAITDWTAAEWPLKSLAVVLPVFMVLVGVEIALNFVLNIYRPRKRDEAPRPAFDSRLLSLLTQPESIARTISEAVNYQFGFEITRSWFWQLLSRAFIGLVVFGLVALLLLSCVVIVEPHQEVLITRFGQISGVVGPGPHLKWPWPISRAQPFDVRRVRQMLIGSKAELLKVDDKWAPVLWDMPHTREEPLNLIVASPMTASNTPTRPDDLNRSNGGRSPVSVSLVNAEIVLQYRIGDLRKYVGSQADPSRLLGVLAEREVTRYLLAHDIDKMIGSGRVAADRHLREIIQARADDAELGLIVVNVSIPSVHPPQKVASAYDKTVQARRWSDIAVEQAETRAIKTLVSAAGSVDRAGDIIDQIEQRDQLKREGGDPEEIARQDARIRSLIETAGGAVAVRIAQARARRWELENTELGRAIRFGAQYDAYRKAPEVYKMRRWLEVLADGMRDGRKYVVVGDFDVSTLRFDFKDVPGDYESQMGAENTNP